MRRSFALSFDYRCPFARVAADHVTTALRDGAEWDVDWVPFSLSQSHVEPGGTDVWDAPETDSGLLALQVTTVVRDRHPERFLDLHQALFDLRHVHGRSIREPDVLGAVLAEHGVDPEQVFAAIADGEPLDTVRKSHERAVAEHDVWGVPIFMAGGRAAFVRLMAPAHGDPSLARRTVERILDLLTGWPDLNEFKHTSLDR